MSRVVAYHCTSYLCLASVKAHPYQKLINHSMTTLWFGAKIDEVCNCLALEFYFIVIDVICLFPCRFYARDSGLLKFKIYAGVLGQSVPASARRLVAFTFHPTDPFAISVQRTNSEYIVNFHIRNAVFS